MEVVAAGLGGRRVGMVAARGRGGPGRRRRHRHGRGPGGAEKGGGGWDFSLSSSHCRSAVEWSLCGRGEDAARASLRLVRGQVDLSVFSQEESDG